MKNDILKIRGARHHNLAGIDVDLPKNLHRPVITGISDAVFWQINIYPCKIMMSCTSDL